ncbi:MAG: hypothetical protein RJB39_575 [Candidatus Parcubacteria bacterium]|jgi:GTP cyclohydrolase I
MNTENNHKTIAASFKNILQALGEDTGREGILKTPDRVAKSLLFLTRGHTEEKNVIQNCKDALFDENIKSHISIKDIEFYSLCEHHVLPFWGTVSISFVPNEDGKILGLSKFGRLVDVFSRRLQVQERLSQQLLSIIKEILQPKAVCIQVKAKHMCMMMRGVEKHNSTTVTYDFEGAEKYEQGLKDLLR